MKIHKICLLVLSLTTGEAAADSISILAPLMELPPADRDAEMTRLVQGNRSQPNPQLVNEVNQQLHKSLDTAYSFDNRATITALAGKLHDPPSLSFLIAHMTTTNQGPIVGGMGYSTFQAAHPYAAAVSRYNTDGILPVLDAVASSTDRKFDCVAETTVSFMDRDIAHKLLDRYEVISQDSKLAKFITVCFAISAPGQRGIQYIEYRLSITTDAEQQARLRKLEADLKSPELRSSLTSLPWP